MNKADNWYTRSADNCRWPDLLPGVCDRCICDRYCHRQLSLSDMGNDKHDKRR